MERTGVIIVAGGSGSRAGGARPKQFRFLDGMPVLARTINTFAAALPGAEIVAVLPEQHIGFWKNLSARFDVAEHKIAAGGAERFHSVRNGLAALTSDPGLIAVQDGVRPLGSVAMIRRVAEAAAKHGAAIPVVEPVDSFRETDGAASQIIDRRRLRIVQTPQVFRLSLYKEALCLAKNTGKQYTDDCQLIEAAGGKVYLTPGDYKNIKITTPEDLLVAEAFAAEK